MAPIRPKQARTGLLCCFAFLAVSCSGVTVREVGETPDLLDSFKASALAGDQLSPRTYKRCAVATSKTPIVSIQPTPPLSFTPLLCAIRSPNCCLPWRK